MSSRRSMTRDIHESIRLLLGKNTKILLKVPVKLELKKEENRILVFTPHRIFIVTAKVPSRIDHQFHILDLKKVESKRPNHIAFSFANVEKPFSFRPNYEQLDQTNSANTIDHLIQTLADAVRRIFPGVPLEHIIGKLEVTPADRVKHIVEWKPPDMKEIGPCGGFSTQYLCMCDYYSLPFREEVAWDVDTIYYSHDSHELCLQDFEHLDHRDLICIISALEHNTWFTKLRASSNSSKLNAELCDRILGVVSKSISLQELHLSAIGARWDFAVKLKQALETNPCSSLQILDLSCNFLEDKGLVQLAIQFAKLPKGMHHLNVSHSSLTSKGLTSLCQSLIANRLNTTTLTYLNICGNQMKEDSQMLCSFLAQPNVLAILDLSNTDTPLELLFPALVRGCTTALTHLNLSRNPFSTSKKTKDVPPTFKQFFATTLSLQYLNMSHCKIPPEALKNLLLGLACNEALANVELNLSNNNLGANGANVLENCIGTVSCMTKLDLSENNLEAEMAGVMQGLAKNKSLLNLNVSKNMTNVKARYFNSVMESIVALIHNEDTAVSKLNLSDCKLKSEINNVINALGSNQSLQTLDITGNLMGDVGARLLAKALQINTRLRTIHLDRNGISIQGYTDLTYALQSNYSMRHIPFPTFDLQSVIKNHPDRVDGIIHRMQELLQRNASPHRFRNTAQAFRLTQGFLLSSTQQILDRVSASTQDSIDALRKMNVELSSPEMSKANELIREAENSKHLLSALHDVTHRGDDVDSKLRQVSGDLTQFIEEHVQQNLTLMLNTAEKQCPSVLNENKIRAHLAPKTSVSPEFIRSLVNDQVGQEIHNKINEINLIMANHISDRVIDEVIDSLTNSGKILSAEVGSTKKKRSLTPDVLKNRSVSVSESLEQESIGHGSDGASQKSESSPLSTPQTTKRKSIQGRKFRPTNTIVDDDPHAPDLLNSSTVLTSTPNTSFLSNGGGGSSEDTVPDLPSTSALTHLGKARPKRPKKHAPTRGTIVSRPSEEIDEGIDRFYTSANNSLSPGSSPPSGSSPNIGDDLLVPPRKGSISSNNSLLKTSKNASKEDLSGSSTLERKSGGASKLGISCLASSTVDEDNVSLVKSPEKKALSPVQSISDIFAKSASSKVAKSRDVAVPERSVSPFAAAKRGEEAVKKPPLAEEERTSSPDLDGKKTPDELVRRHGVGHGTNPDLMAEIKEKRASMAVQQPTDESKSAASIDKSTASPSGIFSGVKLRSTGLAANLTSPTNEFAAATKERSNSGDDKLIDKKDSDLKSGGSILGLRSSKFSNLEKKSSPSPEAKPRSTMTANTGINDESTPLTAPPKPKPLPKPRPWSIVGVDRKSGEVTSVAGADKADAAKNPASSGAAPAMAKGSVRDLINNMNKETTNDKRKGSSLPRGTQPPPGPGGDQPPGELQSANSPKMSKKTEHSSSNNTSDDPRILKLEDDYAYEGVMDV